MRSKKLTLVISGLTGLLLLPSTGTAQSADGILRMCLRDGKNTVRRLKKDLSFGAGSFRTFQKTCIQGPKAEKIKGMEDYQQVLKYYEEAKEILGAAEKEAVESEAEAKSEALSAGAGGDKPTQRSRWKARPKRCTSPEEWDKAAGVATAKPKRTARIAGLEDEEGPSRKVHRRVFQGRSAHRWPSDMTADDQLVRIACGDNVEGIDPFWSSSHDGYSPQFLSGDSRVALGEAVVNEEADAARRVLFKVTLMNECFVNTGWNVKTAYVPYVYCSDAVATPPSLDEVKQAAGKVWPGRDYELDNLIFLYNRAHQAMKEVDAAFAMMERKYPRMKAVYRDSAVDARKRYEARRAKYASAYRVLDPLTKQMFDDPTGTPPAGCEQTLLTLRADLAKELKPKDEDGVTKLRVGHPLGYQITEALSWCYMGSNKMAKAKLEADVLAKGNRRVNLAEEIAFSRLDALQEVKNELKSRGKIEAAIPNYDKGAYGVPLPGSIRRSPRFHELLSSRGRYKTLGEKEKEPAVVASKKKLGAGVKLVFKKFKYIRKYRDFKCKETNKVDRYDIRYNADGSTSLSPVYRQNCWKVGPVKKQTIVYQEKPVVIPKTVAKNIQKGMQVVVLDNTQKEGDAAVVYQWWPKKGREKAVVVQGVPVR